MSTLKADAVTTKSDNTDLTLTGGGTGVPNLEAGFKVGGSAGVPTASVQDDAITLAKLAAGTDGELITWDASGDPAAVAVGTATHVLTSNGVGAAPTFQAAAGGGFTLATAQASTSGSSVTFTGIPAGVRVVNVMFFSVSTDSWPEGFIGITLGDSGGLETSGYSSAAVKLVNGSGVQVSTSTASFKINDSNDSGEQLLGIFHFTNEDSSNNAWVMNGGMYQTSGQPIFCCGGKELSGELTQLKIETSVGTFDQGTMNISYL